MRKRTVIAGFFSIIFVAISVTSVSADSAVTASATTSAAVHVGGLGTGLSHMVQSILGDKSSPSAPVAAQSAYISNKVNPDFSVVHARSMTNKASTTIPTDSLVHGSIQTDIDVSEYIGHLLQNDGNLQAIEASDSHVRVTYLKRGIIFKLVQMSVPVIGEAYVSGKTTVTYPWYAGMAGIRSDIRSRFDARIAKEINTSSLTPENRIQLIHQMYSFFADEFSS